MIELRSLGGVSILSQDGSPITLRSRKHVGLLLLLAGGGRRIYARTRLCDYFWDSDGSRARHSLSQAVYDLSQHLGPVISRGPGEDLSLDLHQLNYDVSSFESAIQAGDLSKAVDIYRGPFADNLVDAGTAEFEYWLESERTRLARLSELALRRYVAECEARGQWGRMCVAALKLAAIAPLDEEVHRTFMRALWLQGDAASALRHYESIAADLNAELPTGVSVEMEELVRRIRQRPKLDSQLGRGIDREPPFVGREREFQALREVVTHIESTETTAIVVSGEAGIGKSRLMKEFSISIQVEALRVLSSRCYQAEEDLPYSPIIDALMPLVQDMVKDEPGIRQRFRRLAYLLPDFGSREGQEPERDFVDPAAWRRQLYEEVASFLMAATQREPIVWIVDDVQWIDRASGGLIHYLARRLADRPFLFVLTIRNARGVDALPPLPVAPPAPGTVATLSIPLRPLTEEQIRDIVCHAGSGAHQAQAADLAIRLSAGNPYYALEVLEAAVESSEWARSASDWDPLNDDRLRKVLDIRISGLGRERTRLLQSIAILERFARPRLVAGVIGSSLAETARMAEELYTRSLIVDEEERVSFTNDAMREFVCAEMTTIQRAALHLRAGQALEAEADATPGSLATHFYYGGDWPRSFSYAMEAARLAQSAAGHSEASHFAGIAIKVAPGLEERRVALEIRADSLLATGELAEAAQCYREILRSGPATAGAESEIQLRLAATEIERCNWEAAATVLQAGIMTIEDVQSIDEKLGLLAEHSTLVLKHAVRTDDAVAADEAGHAIDRALSQVGEFSDASSQTKLAILTAKAVLVGLDGPSSEALKYLLEAEGHVRTARSWQKNRYFTYRGIVKAWLADWDGAEADFRYARGLAERTADRVGLMTQWNNLACIALERGDWGTAEERLASAARVQSGLGLSNDTSLPITLNKANLLFYQGYASQAAEMYQAAATLSDQQESSDRTAEIRACLGLVALQRGEREDADRYWQSLESARSTSAHGLGTRERFKIGWFAAAMAPGLLDSGFLLRAADSERGRDLPSSLKLLWLNAVLTKLTEPDIGRIRRTLQEYNLAWFCHVTKRWSRGAGFTV